VRRALPLAAACALLAGCAHDDVPRAVLVPTPIPCVKGDLPAPPAPIDDLGYFTAASVRAPLRIITGRNYDIPNFARHLKELSETSRGGMLQRIGETRRIRYRFESPIMRPYIVMRGFADGLISRVQMKKIESL
jgi:hypothetical protein